MSPKSCLLDGAPECIKVPGPQRQQPPQLSFDMAVGRNQWDPILGDLCTTHFRTVVGLVDVHGGLTDLDFDPWPYRYRPCTWAEGEHHQSLAFGSYDISPMRQTNASSESS